MGRHAVRQAGEAAARRLLNPTAFRAGELYLEPFVKTLPRVDWMSTTTKPFLPSGGPTCTWDATSCPRTGGACMYNHYVGGKTWPSLSADMKVIVPPPPHDEDEDGLYSDWEDWENTSAPSPATSLSSIPGGDEWLSI
ncbi:hypothetical protein MKZ38_009935 [Zalerion maritima]|uniref:Uncharacterized protein n=1 Tax=Zalerion maritima TaxID=339359 RepID=A0AAD5RU14_9PEZI|nr:hypothetical protein MKZ38_009935 [Zalerion maritima]